MSKYSPSLSSGHPFYTENYRDIAPIDDAYSQIKNPAHLYALLSRLWCAKTCTPRLAAQWDEKCPSLGQCSITAFLVQDIFGGKVYGIPRAGGTVHCYNVIGDTILDLTSEQFGDEVLDYQNRTEQSRDTHFAKEEKRLRYKLLWRRLRRQCHFSEC